MKISKKFLNIFVVASILHQDNFFHRASPRDKKSNAVLSSVKQIMFYFHSKFSVSKIFINFLEHLIFLKNIHLWVEPPTFPTPLLLTQSLVLQYQTQIVFSLTFYPDNYENQKSNKSEKHSIDCWEIVRFCFIVKKLMASQIESWTLKWSKLQNS